MSENIADRIDLEFNSINAIQGSLERWKNTGLQEQIVQQDTINKALILCNMHLYHITLLQDQRIEEMEKKIEKLENQKQRTFQPGDILKSAT